MACYYGICLNKHKFLEKVEDTKDLEPYCEYCTKFIRWKKVDDTYCQDDIGKKQIRDIGKEEEKPDTQENIPTKQYSDEDLMIPYKQDPAKLKSYLDMLDADEEEEETTNPGTPTAKRKRLEETYKRLVERCIK